MWLERAGLWIGEIASAPGRLLHRWAAKHIDRQFGLWNLNQNAARMGLTPEQYLARVATRRGVTVDEVQAEIVRSWSRPQ